MTRNGARLDHEGLNVEKVSQDGAKILIKKGEETFRSHSTYFTCDINIGGMPLVCHARILMPAAGSEGMLAN